MSEREPESPQGERGHREAVVEVTIAAPLETVWRALRDRAELRRWHGWDYDGLDGEIEVIYFTEASEPEPATAGTRRLVTGASVFELADRDGRTVVRLVMAAPPEDPTWQGYYAEIKQGWLTFVQQLRYAVERHPGEDRATVYVSGVPLDPGQPGVVDLLGLGAVGGPGEPYAAALATGDDVAGEVWFRSEHQLGVTVAGWGDGLLVLTDRWSPDGAAGAILSTYGLDGPALAALGERWQGWWAKHYGTGSPTS
jgi:hypothetical protein